MKPVIAFRKVKDPYGWLSNMSPHPVKGLRLDLEFRTAEALFQALRFTDPTVQDLIRAQKSPMAAKMVAKANADKMVVVPRSDSDLNIMRHVIRAKVLQHPALFSALLKTEGHTIIEDTTARPNESGLYWGAARQPDGTWKGMNMLGELWMILRRTLIQEGHRA